MNTISSGLWSGIIATGPMTLAMFKLDGALPAQEKSSLPPATLTHQITGADSPNLTLLSHFAYGMGCSLIYSLLTRKPSSAPVAKGMGFGLLVWGVSYLALTPGVGLRARAPNMTLKRNGMMILAHLIWGANVGYANKKLRSSDQRLLGGGTKAPAAE